MGEEEMGIETRVRGKFRGLLGRFRKGEEQKGAKEIVTPAQALNNLIKRLENSKLEIAKRAGQDLNWNLEALLRELRDARAANPALTIKQFLVENKKQGEDQPHLLGRDSWYDPKFTERVRNGTWLDPAELADILGLEGDKSWDAVKKHIGFYTDGYHDLTVDMSDGSKVKVKEGIAHLERESEKPAGACLRVKQAEDKAFPAAWALEVPQETVIEYLDAKVSGAPSLNPR